ncbi:Subtilase family protein [Variovorax sp. CF079]|uniref:S8 family serine peptidase n=1 Tax=Variovorax sp. CF079 TaxID=1882774 RepID=UPI0008879405|nr:S8 family serine peptidase [Variovorax sp. CF079]SDD77948.1 Subtilase family protein [Variovorax sp. CF079]
MEHENRYVEAAKELASKTGTPVDPYLIWGLLTSFRYFRKSDRWVSVIIECRTSIRKLTNVIAEGHGALDWLHIPSVYVADGTQPPPEKARHCSARIELDMGQPYPWLRVLELYWIAEIGRFEVSQPVALDERLLTGFTRSLESAPFVAVIDDFVGFLHPELAARFQAVWSQDLSSPNASGSHWKAPGDMSYGFEYRQPKGVPPTTDRVYPPVLRRATHGSHVTSLAAGKYVRPDAADMTKGKLPFTDLVSDPAVKLIGVHLPLGTVVDTSGGSMSAQVIDGLRFIIRRAGENSYGAVNISYATHAGPHDGQSILESAIDSLVRLRNGHLAVVFPVGNQYEARCHARFRLDPTEVRSLKWHILPDSSTLSLLEIWLPPGADDLIGVKVEDPSGNKSNLVQIGNIWPTTDPANSGGFAVIFLKWVANRLYGNAGTMVLIAVAPTRPRGSTNLVAMHGVWRVEVHNCSTQAVGEIDAWIERNDSLFGRPVRGRQSYFVDPYYEKNGRRPTQPNDNAWSPVKREGSFNSFANGLEPIAVGGYVGCRRKTSKVADYSAGGWALTRHREGTDVLARSDEFKGLPGVRGAGIGAVSVVRMNGTSVAAPQVTRLIVNWMAAIKGPLGTGQILLRLSQAAGVPPAGSVQLQPAIPGDDSGNTRRVGFGELSFPP